MVSLPNSKKNYITGAFVDKTNLTSRSFMEKKYFVLRLLPPRPSFTMDMTETEKAVMLRHVAYWRALTLRGTAILFGPVMDPAAPYGLGIVEVEGQSEAEDLAAGDPVVQSEIGCRYDIQPMRIGLIRTAQA
jgi:uncharacterized protein YciI